MKRKALYHIEKSDERFLKQSAIYLVTHFVTISAIADEALSSGEGVLLNRNNNGYYETVGRLKFGAL